MHGDCRSEVGTDFLLEAEKLWALDLLTKALARFDVVAPNDAARLRRAFGIRGCRYRGVARADAGRERGRLAARKGSASARRRLESVLEDELRDVSPSCTSRGFDRRALHERLDELFPGLLPPEEAGVRDGTAATVRRAVWQTVSLGRVRWCRPLPSRESADLRALGVLRVSRVAASVADGAGRTRVVRSRAEEFMRALARTLIGLSSIALLHAPALAGVIVVASNGTGQATDLPAAIAAAVDGDVLLVKSGTYSAFTITNKSLDLVADAGASVIVLGTSTVQQLAATRSVSLTGLSLRGPAGVGSNIGTALRLVNDSGSVRVQGCDLAGHDGNACTEFAWGGSALFADHCNDVALARCTLAGGNAGDFRLDAGYGGYGGDCLQGLNSRVALYGCSLRGGRGASSTAACGGFGAGGYAGFGGDACDLISCPQSFAASCTFQGGDGGDSFFDLPPGVGAWLITSGTLTALDSSFLSGHDAAGGTSVGVRIDGGATFSTLPGLGRTLTTNRVLREGSQLRLEFTGQPGDVVELTFAESGRFQSSPALRGVSLLRTSKPTPVLQAGVVDASGTLHVTWPIDELGTGVQARRLFLQAVFRDTSGVTTLSTPATVVLLDSAL